MKRIQSSYEVGDIVRILSKDEIKGRDVHFGFAEEMEEFCDLVLEIEAITDLRCIKTGDIEPQYTFANAPYGMNTWAWGEDMFELVTPVSHAKDEALMQSWLDLLQ